jgi:hypothetical protein
MAETTHLPETLWQRLRANPERAPELIALAAAERFAPAAEEWAREHARRPPDKRAKKAIRSHVRLARLEGAALGIGGVLTAAADLAALAWIQSRMILFVAAAYGHDPRDPRRPAEMLVLHGVYESVDDARAALDGAGKLMAQAMAERAMTSKSDRHIADRLMRYLGRRLATKAAGRLVPLISSPIAAHQNAAATKDLGEEVDRYYRALPAP